MALGLAMPPSQPKLRAERILRKRLGWAAARRRMSRPRSTGSQSRWSSRGVRSGRSERPWGRGPWGRFWERPGLRLLRRGRELGWSGWDMGCCKSGAWVGARVGDGGEESPGLSGGGQGPKGAAEAIRAAALAPSGCEG